MSSIHLAHMFPAGCCKERCEPPQLRGEVVQTIPLASYSIALLRKMVFLITDVLNLECNPKRGSMSNNTLFFIPKLPYTIFIITICAFVKLYNYQTNCITHKTVVKLIIVINVTRNIVNIREYSTILLLITKSISWLN